MPYSMKSRKRKITSQVRSASKAGRRAGHRGLGRNPVIPRPKPRTAQSKTPSPQNRIAPKAASVLQRTHQSTVGRSFKKAVRNEWNFVRKAIRHIREPIRKEASRSLARRQTATPRRPRRVSATKRRRG